ncbi:MAG: hypothetical protein ABTQ93_02880 [Candidatus Competibacter denitrificans]
MESDFNEVWNYAFAKQAPKACAQRADHDTLLSNPLWDEICKATRTPQGSAPSNVKPKPGSVDAQHSITPLQTSDQLAQGHADKAALLEAKRLVLDAKGFFQRFPSLDKDLFDYASDRRRYLGLPSHLFDSCES